VIKDNDLDRKFYPEEREKLISLLQRDVDFLKLHNCMDYSLLVGVHNLSGDKKKKKKKMKIIMIIIIKVKSLRRIKKKKESKAQSEIAFSHLKKQHNSKNKKKFTQRKKLRNKNNNGNESPKKRNKHKGNKKLRRHHHIKKNIFPPIRSSSDSKIPEVYFVAIIDILSRYGVRKKLAHLLKSALWTDAALSTVPADYYAERYFDYVKTILIVPGQEEEEE